MYKGIGDDLFLIRIGNLFLIRVEKYSNFQFPIRVQRYRTWVAPYSCTEVYKKGTGNKELTILSSHIG